MAAFPSSSSVATNLMLAIHEKKTTAIDLHRPLRNYVAFTYSEREAQLLEDDLETLNQLRSEVDRAQDLSPAARRDLLISYYKALCLVETRFPISPEKHHVNTVSFLWYDAFRPKQKATQQNIHLEKAAVLFNLGATYSKIGLSYDRTTVDGRRQASHAFIAAAGAFAYLRDNESIKASIGQSITVDVSVECVGMLERLMLAQAQESVFENTIAKGSTPGVCAKISRQVGLYYEEALAALNASPLKDHFEKGWISHVLLKAALFYGEACFRYGIEMHEKEEISEEIARLRSGISHLTEAKKSSKGAPAQLLEAINKLEASINCNLDRAVKENDRVYLMRVPSPSSLSPLPSFSMVKPMNMNGILDASKEKLFTSLVPDNSAKALSRYTEMVDDVIRTQAERLQQASELTRVRLKEMDLPDSILALDGHLSLPDDLKDDVEAVQISGGPAGLETDLQQLRDLRRINHEMLIQTEELLQKEAAEDAHFRGQFGTRWTRPQSSTLTKNLQDRLNRFASNIKEAAESDAKIERSVRDNSAFMSILDHRPIESALPTLARPIMSLDVSEDAILGALKQSLRQLESLGAQRAGLEDMLKEMKRKDDILPKLMTSSGSYDDLFRKEISKYDHICEEISQNIETQEQLLMQIQTQNEDFSAIFNLEDYKASREKCYKQIQAAIAKYREIKENINEGLKFYATLQDAIANMKQQCSDFLMTRSIQCREMMEDVQRQMTGLSFQDHKSSGPYQPLHQPPASGSRPQPENQNPSHIHPQPPYYMSPGQPMYRPPEQSSRPYGNPPYGGPQPPPPNHNTSHGQGPHPHGHAHGWQGSYYNPQPQQPGPLPQPPYTVQSPYPPPYQGGYYRQ
ncbi:PREDICTED: ALG-2 interacting protein X-like [Tarenaya hassleriana]|uniref:ALG-2 interacting protein X-like n=1 Tax=Tarenaya hassleriana TaxID=28532 RepID=UPI00053CA979|nr:PREDICTED: ALG-2 interacting protein X-like [Tarenaya hassleriana]